MTHSWWILLRCAVGLFLFIPFLLLWPIAVTSTVCDDLMKALNHARLRHLSQHERIFALETGASPDEHG